jgi:hypothetical protein
MVNCVCKHAQGSLVQIKTPTQLKLIDRSMTTPPRVLSPSSILPSPSSFCAFIPTRKTSACFKNVIMSVDFTLLLNCLSQKLRNLKLCKSGNVCANLPCTTPQKSKGLNCTTAGAGSFSILILLIAATFAAHSSYLCPTFRRVYSCMKDTRWLHLLSKNPVSDDNICISTFCNARAKYHQ